MQTYQDLTFLCAVVIRCPGFIQVCLHSFRPPDTDIVVANVDLNLDGEPCWKFTIFLAVFMYPSEKHKTGQSCA